MAKKRIADLLKEEVEKSSPQATETDSKPSTSTNPSDANGSATLEVAAVTSEQNGHQGKTTKRKRSPTKADLEAMVGELKAELELSRSTESALQKNITRLQATITEQKQHLESLSSELESDRSSAVQSEESDRAAQQQLQTELTALKEELTKEKALVKSLQQDLKQVPRLNAELAEAKATVLQLVDTNNNAKALKEQVTALEAALTQEKKLVQTLQGNLKQMDVIKAELASAQKQLAATSTARSTASLRPKSVRPPSRTVPLGTPLSSAATSKTITPVTGSDGATQLQKEYRPTKFLSTDSKFKRLRKASMDYQRPSKPTLSNNEIGWFD